jgi:hypothetical protein
VHKHIPYNCITISIDASMLMFDFDPDSGNNHLQDSAGRSRDGGLDGSYDGHWQRGSRQKAESDTQVKTPCLAAH